MKYKNKISRALIILIAIFIIFKLSKYLYHNVFDEYFKEKTWNESVDRAKSK